MEIEKEKVRDAERIEIEVAEKAGLRRIEQRELPVVFVILINMYLD